MKGGSRAPAPGETRRRRGGAVLCLTTALLVGVAAASPAQQATVEQEPPVKLGPPPALDLPEIQSFELQNGVPVYLVELHTVPVVQIDLIVRSGAASEDLTAAGVADLTADMLDEGTTVRKALDLAEALEYLGARLSTAAGWDASFVELHAPAARVDSALAVMADVALRPSFPDGELERKRTERLTNFLLARDVPSALASEALAANLYPERHRYHRRVRGTAETIGNLTRDDLRRFYATHYVPRNAALVVVGDVTVERMRPMLEETFGGWGGEAGAMVRLPEAPQVERTRVVLVDRPGSEQSEILLSRVGPPRTTEDYVQLVVLNTILGGPFSSRLNQNLRETHGYVYHAYSGFDFRGGPGPFFAGAPARTAVTDSAVVEFVRELQRIREERPSRDEVEKAKRYIALSFPAEFETTGDVASHVAELVIHRLPLDYYDDFVDEVNAVTPEQVQAGARKYMDPRASLIVVVGDAAKIRRPLEELGLGAIELLSIEQVMGPAPKLAEAEGSRIGP